MSEWREKLRRGTGECGSVREDGGGQVICPMMSRYVTLYEGCEHHDLVLIQARTDAHSRSGRVIDM